MRSVPLWVGKNDDAKVPPRVRLRVLEQHNHTCHITGRKIAPGEPWELEHVVPLWLGGRHAEDNLAPALVGPHKRKSAAELTVKAKIADVAKAAYGIKSKKGRGFPKRPKAERPKRDQLPMLPATLNPLWRGRVGQLHQPIGGDIDD